MKDAALLLACARAQPAADPSLIFESFEGVRRRRVRQMVRDSYAIGSLATAPNRFAAGTRDLLTRLVPEAINMRRLAVYASATAFGHNSKRRSDSQEDRPSDRILVVSGDSGSAIGGTGRPS